MRPGVITIVLLLVTLVNSWSQNDTDSTLFDINYRFVDGVYTDLAQLRSNAPDRTLATLEGNLVLQEEAYTLKVEILHPKGRPDLSLNLETIDYICVKGLPYKRVYSTPERGFTVYAGLRARGRLSYFTYEQMQPDTVLIKAYNPANGIPFRQQNLVREMPVRSEWIINMISGEERPFDLENLLLMVADDPVLVKTLEALTPAEAADRLQRCLLIYDDRHPLYLPSTPQNEN